MSEVKKPQVGISACLLGARVRFDGGHKKNAFVMDTCTMDFDLHPVCPEVELGLGIPRPAIQLRRLHDNRIRLVESKSPDIDMTNLMQAFSQRRCSALPALDGFIFKKDSPSCGMQRVAIVDSKTGMRDKRGIGIFAKVFMQRFPHVACEEEGRLNDINLRENFLERVYAHYRWRQIDFNTMSVDEVLSGFRKFHQNYKLVLMAKDHLAYRQLGQWVAQTNVHNLQLMRKHYFNLFMPVMARVASRGQHVNVLMHLAGYLKNKITRQDKIELHYWFDLYRQNKVNRVTPLALLQHHFNHHPNQYIAEQYYWTLFPGRLIQTT